MQEGGGSEREREAGRGEQAGGSPGEREGGKGQEGREREDKWGGGGGNWREVENPFLFITPEHSLWLTSSDERLH